ncbi:hypothetical protein KI387_023606, partial [Taxus chinensis]
KSGIYEIGKWLALDSVGRRDDSKLTWSLKSSGELSPIGRDATGRSTVGRGGGKVDDAGSSFGEEEGKMGSFVGRIMGNAGCSTGRE